jgi:hypothetical protein
MSIFKKVPPEINEIILGMVGKRTYIPLRFYCDHFNYLVYNVGGLYQVKGVSHIDNKTFNFETQKEVFTFLWGHFKISMIDKKEEYDYVGDIDHEGDNADHLFVVFKFEGVVTELEIYPFSQNYGARKIALKSIKRQFKFMLSQVGKIFIME